LRKTLIVAGGTVENEFAVRYIKEQGFDYFIAADAGMHFYKLSGITPDEILGDYDSVSPGELDYFRKNQNIVFHTYPAEKDGTDTELALALALERQSGEVHILGATGSRLDHVFGAVHALGIGLAAHVPCYLLDAHNRIRLIDGRTVLRKDGQYGQYVSLIPLTSAAGGVTLDGFKYPLTDYTMQGFNTLGVSNEIVADEAVVELDSGVLILVESRD